MSKNTCSAAASFIPKEKKIISMHRIGLTGMDQAGTSWMVTRKTKGA